MHYHAPHMSCAPDLSYTVAVRTLCEFTARRGDLDLRFSPSPTAQEGIAGHALVAARRPPGYRTELPLGGSHRSLKVRGRADGWQPHLRQLEEIKTFRGELQSITEAQRQLHWAQLKVYGWLMCQQEGLHELRLALVYFNLDEQQESALCETHTADALRVFFEQQCDAFQVWAQQESAHRAARQAALAAMVFPHADFRTGQRELAEAVWRSAVSGRPLLVEAPTGIGKTVGTLFPALKAMGSGRQPLDKLFFLTAKSSGRALALQALQGLADAAPAGRLPLRVLELVARDKACEHPDKACHGESCPLAQGFFDRLPAAREAAVQLPALDRPALRRLALAHSVCPYYLAQDLLRWADVVVGDYNYYFDAHALLYAMTRAQEWRVALLVDEAHNLVERARQMYSAELDETALAQARRAAPKALKNDLERLRRRWSELARERPAYSVLDEVPPKFLLALQQVAGAIAAWQTEHPHEAQAELQRFFFDLLAFTDRAQTLGEHSLFDISVSGPAPTRAAVHPQCDARALSQKPAGSGGLLRLVFGDLAACRLLPGPAGTARADRGDERGLALCRRATAGQDPARHLHALGRPQRFAAGHRAGAGTAMASAAGQVPGIFQQL
jgi:DNA excision repair protein ERCC-2